MEILGIAQQGLQQSQKQVEKAAQRIASAGLSTTDPPAADTFTDDVVSLISAKNGFEANLRLVHVADDMQKHALDILA